MAVDALPIVKYRQISNIRRTKSQNLNASHLILQFVQFMEAMC